MLALLLAVINCVALDQGSATMSPTIAWDAVTDPDLAGYVIYYRPVGDLAWRYGKNFPCFQDDEGVRRCPGADFSINLAQVAPADYDFKPGVLYEFVVKAIDTSGNESIEPSNLVEVCWPSTCGW